MNELGAAEWLGIVATGTTVISLFFNVIQWLKRKDMTNMHYASLFQTYNNMFKIAELCDAYKGKLKEDAPEERSRLEGRNRLVEQIVGIVYAGRTDILSFTQKYLKRRLYRQHPARPEEDLPRPKGPSTTGERT